MGKPSRKVGSNRKHKQNLHKTHVRGKFELRHIDQVWEDVRKLSSQVHEPGKSGPMGTTSRAELDEDVPGYGRHYCIPCAKYYQDATSLVDHEKSKPHKKRVKLLLSTAKPHNQADAERAGGLGAPDNGRRLRPSTRGAGAAAMDAQ